MKSASEVGAVGGLVDLLAQEVQGRFTAVVAHDHVVADALRRPQREHAARGQPLFGDDPLEHRARRGGFGGLAADHRVLEDGGVASQLQSLKNGVQSMHAAPERIVQHVQAGLARRGVVVVPAAVELCARARSTTPAMASPRLRWRWRTA